MARYLEGIHPLRDLITLVATALILLLTAALAGPWFIDWTAHRGWVESELARITATRVRVNGEVDLKLLPVPKLSLRDVRVTSHRADGPVLDIARLRFELSATSLLRGELRFLDAELERPQLSLNLLEDGRLLSPGLPYVSATGVQIEKLTVRDGSLAFRKPGQNDPIVIGGLDFTGEANSLVGPYRGSGSLRMGSTPIKWRFSTSAIEQDRLRTKFIIDETPLNPRADFDGSLIFSGDLPGGALSLEGPVIFSATTRLSGLTLPWRLSGQMKASHAGVAMEEAELRAGEDERALIANGAWSFERLPEPRMRIQMQARQLDLDRLLGAPNRPAGRRLVALVTDALADRSLSEPWPFQLEAKFEAPNVLLAGEAFSDLRSEVILSGRDVPRIKFSAQAPARASVLLDGTLETGAAASFRGRAEIIARDIPRLASYLTLLDPDAMRWRDLPFRALELSGDVDVSGVGAIGRQLHVRLDRSDFSGALAYTRAQGAERARFFADISSDSLDLEDLPELAGPMRLTNDIDVSLALEARAVRLERLGAGVVDAGRIGLRLVKDARETRLEKLNVENIGGASFSARGRFGETGHDLTAQVDARRLNDLSNLLLRIAPGAWSEALSQRAVALSPLRMDAALRGRDWMKPDDLRLEGTARGTKFNLTLKPVADGADITGLAENPDAGLLLRQLGLETLPINNPGTGRFQLRATGNGSKGFTGATSLSAARVELVAEGRASGALDAPDMRGTVRMRSNDASNFLRLIGFGLPDISASLPLEVGAELSISKDAIAFDNLSGLAAGSFLNGALRSEERDGVLRWSGRLKTDRLGLPMLAMLSLGPTPAVPRGAVWPEQKFAPGLVETPRMKIEISAGEFDLAENLTAREAQFALRLEPGLVGLEDARMKIGEGQLAGQLALRRTAEGVALLAKADLTNLALPQGPVAGRLSGHVELTSTGLSHAELAAGLTGEGQAQIDGLSIANADASGIARLIAGVDRGQVNVDERDLRTALLREVERAPFVGGKRELLLNGAGGVLRFQSFDEPRLSLSFDARQWTQEARVTLASPTRPRDWTGEAPAATLIWQGRAGAMQRTVDAALLFNAISTRAIIRETARAEALDEDIRERASIQRRVKALEFLRRREKEIVLFQQEERRRSDVLRPR